MNKKQDKSSDIIEPNKPDFFKFIREVKDSAKVGGKMDKRDQNFALLTELDGWRDFKELAFTRIDRLKSLRDYESAGRDLSELGLRFLVADIVSDEIENLIRRVEQSKDIYDKTKKS